MMHGQKNTKLFVRYISSENGRRLLPFFIYDFYYTVRKVWVNQGGLKLSEKHKIFSQLSLVICSARKEIL